MDKMMMVMNSFDDEGGGGCGITEMQFIIVILLSL